MPPHAARQTLLAHDETGSSVKIGISGHQNIPRDAVSFVADGITDVLNRAGRSLTGVSSLAVGADQLFAQTVLERGGRLHIVLPCAKYEDTFASTADLKRFRALLAQAHTVEQLPADKPSEEAFLKAGLRVVDLSELLLAVWDGLPAKGKGGTADIVAYAKLRQVPVEIVWPAGVLR